MRRSYPRPACREMRWGSSKPPTRCCPASTRAPAATPNARCDARAWNCTCRRRPRAARHATVKLSDTTVAPYAVGDDRVDRGPASVALPRDSGLPVDERGRVAVDAYLRVPGTPDMFAIGDAAAVPDPADPGRPCPPTAQHALRQGMTAATNFVAAVRPG